jgi:hypothetical protein
MGKLALGVVMGFTIFSFSFGIPTHLQKAKEGCEAGKKSDCIRLSIVLYQKKDFKDAFKYSKKACDLGSSDGCSKVGFHYLNGLVVKKDLKKAVEYFKKACDLDESRGCYNLALLYDKGEGVKKDEKTAKKLYEKACKLRNRLACQVLGKDVVSALR